MNLDLETHLGEHGVPFERLEKRRKVKLLARWHKYFPEEKLIPDTWRALRQKKRILSSQVASFLCSRTTIAE